MTSAPAPTIATDNASRAAVTDDPNKVVNKLAEGEAAKVKAEAPIVVEIVAAAGAVAEDAVAAAAKVAVGAKLQIAAVAVAEIAARAVVAVKVNRYFPGNAFKRRSSSRSRKSSRRWDWKR